MRRDAAVARTRRARKEVCRGKWLGVRDDFRHYSVLALLPQDVLVLTKLVSYGGRRPPMAQMATDLGLSPSQVHASLKRLEHSRLVAPQTNEPHLRAVEELLLHGVKYAFPAFRGEATRGTPTAYAAHGLASFLHYPRL